MFISSSLPCFLYLHLVLLLLLILLLFLFLLHFLVLFSHFPTFLLHIQYFTVSLLSFLLHFLLFLSLWFLRFSSPPSSSAPLSFSSSSSPYPHVRPIPLSLPASLPKNGFLHFQGKRKIYSKFGHMDHHRAVNQGCGQIATLS